MEADISNQETEETRWIRPEAPFVLTLRTISDTVSNLE